MKKLIVGLTTLILILLVTPFFMGFYVEHIQDEHAALIQRQNPFLQVKKISHERGWFSSESVYEYSQTGQTEDPKALRIVAKVRSHHGPLPFASLTDDAASFRPGLAALGYEIDLAKALTSFDISTDKLPTIGRQGHLGFTGNYQYRCDISAGETNFQVGTGPTINLKWQPVACEGTSRFLRGDERYEINAPELQFSFVDGDTLTLKAASYIANITQADTDFPLIDGAIQIGRMVAAKAGKEQPSMTAEGIAITLENNDSDNKISSHASYTVDTVTSANANYQGLFARLKIDAADKASAIALRNKFVSSYLALSKAQDDVQARQIADQQFNREAVLATLPLLGKTFHKSSLSFGWDGSQQEMDLSPLVNSVLDVSSKGLEFKLFTTDLSGGLLLGGYHLVLDEYQLAAQPIKLGSNPPPFKLLRMENLSLRDYSELHSETTLGLHTEYKLKSLLLDSIDIRDAIYSTSLINIDSAAANKITQVFYRPIADVLFGEDLELQLSEDDKLQIDESLPTLLSNAKLKLNALAFATANGKAQATANGQLLKVPSILDIDMGEWLSEIAASGQLTIDKKLVNDVAEMVLQQQISSAGFSLSDERKKQMREAIEQEAAAALAGYVKEGMLKEQQNAFTSEAKLEKAELTVNGNAVPLF